MKVKHYNEMMAHLIRPGFNGGGSVSNNTVLPKRKPAAEVKKRKKINYEKIKQYLGKESQDLVERELGFAIGGGVSPNQLKQRFMEIITSIQEAEAEEVPMLVAEAKDLKDKIDELNKLLSPERQIQITSQGLDFDNPLLDAAKIQKTVTGSDIAKSMQPQKTIEDTFDTLTAKNPANVLVPNFPRGEKGTGADPEEKEDIFEREQGQRIATRPDGQFTKASMRMPPRSTNLRDMIQDALKKFDKEEYPEIKTEDSFADGGRIGFKKAGFVFGDQTFNVDIPNMTPVQSESFQKGLKDLEKWSQNPNAENWIETFRQPSKTGQTHQSDFSLNLRKYIQGEPVKARTKELFDSVNIKNLLGNTAEDIQTYTPQEFRRVSNLPKSKKAADVALNKSMKAANAVRAVFVKDVDADLEDVARGIFGKDFDKASVVVQEDMLSKASDDTAKLLEALTTNRKVKGFKDISEDKMGDIIQNLEDNTKDFKFREGTIREYRFRVRDSLLGIKTESKEGFRNLRNTIAQKDKVIDEVFGLSATFKNAPGYTENVQLIDKKINNIKGKQIDKPFSAIVNAVKNKKDIVQYEGKDINISQAIKKFNAKSKEFSAANNISTPQIFVGDNLNASKLVSGFNDYSSQAQKNILQNAKEGFVLNSTKPSTPIGAFKPSGGMTLGMNRIDPKALTAFGKAGQLAKVVAKGEAFIAPVFLAGGAMYGLPFSRNINEATYGLLGDSKNEFLIKQNPDAEIFLNIMKEDEKFRNLLENYNNSSPYDRLRFKDKMEAKRNEFNQKVDAFRALPEDQIIKSQQAAERATLQYENLIKQNRENRFQYGVIPKKQLFIDIADTFKSMAPPKPVENVLGTPIPTGQMQTEFAGGGLAKEAGDRSGKPPESGPTPQGLASIIKRGRKY